MPKVEIEFDGSFEGDILPIPIGRLYLGRHILRLFFDTHGKLRGSIDEGAIIDGSLAVMVHPKDMPLGFGVKG